jgi:L-alanine-DL-glutamate epimerase-like enolase superfamily enzyme
VVLALDIKTERWLLKEPFRISGYVFTESEVVVVSLKQDGVTGQGEGAGVYYRKETPETMVAQIESVRAAIERGVSREALRELLPIGGARNAIDCALWDMEAKRSGIPAWKAAGLQPLGITKTTFTIGADTPEKMAASAKRYAPAPRLKLKLTGEDDAPRLTAVRAARPDAWIGVDANQGFTRVSLEALMPVLQESNISLIEQPVKVGQEAELDGLNSPIPLAADESVQGLDDIAKAKGRFSIVSIKLDKCGGLTEGLMMARAIREQGMRPMVGCMASTSLAMIPGCLVGQLCDFIDMDGAMFFAHDRPPQMIYRDGDVICPDTGWGMPTAGESLRAVS